MGRRRGTFAQFEDPATTADAVDIDLRWVNGVMAFLAAANFVVSAIHAVLLFAG